METILAFLLMDRLEVEKLIQWRAQIRKSFLMSKMANLMNSQEFYLE
jgi:hypothetical protein